MSLASRSLPSVKGQSIESNALISISSRKRFYLTCCPTVAAWKSPLLLGADSNNSLRRLIEVVDGEYNYVLQKTPIRYHSYPLMSAQLLLGFVLIVFV